MLELSADEKAEQIERDFGIPHPRKRLHASLRHEDNSEVTPFTKSVGRDRLAEFDARGFEREDAFIVMLMRGARREAVAASAGRKIGEFVADVRARMRQVSLDAHVTEAHRTLNLWAGVRRG